jgi:hypothetical protein
MIPWLQEILLSGLVLGLAAYAIVWSLHNLSIFVDTVMAWADRQETFLQRMVSCESCLTVQVSMALAAAQCLAFHRGLWTWLVMTAAIYACAMAVNRKVGLLDEPKEP